MRQPSPDPVARPAKARLRPWSLLFVAGIYVVWLTWLAYVAWVNINAGNQ